MNYMNYPYLSLPTGYPFNITSYLPPIPLCPNAIRRSRYSYTSFYPSSSLVQSGILFPSMGNSLTLPELESKFI